LRKRFEAQLELGAIPIGEITFNLKSRHELPPVLMALQHVFVQPELNEAIFTLLEQNVYPTNNDTGRPGMSLWEIFVLSVVRLTLDVDYDFLLDLANNHNKVRQLLGINTGSFRDPKEYNYQTLMDNVLLLDDQLLEQINRLIVSHGHKIKKNDVGIGEDEKHPLVIKTDSYAVETNIHFPTDLNLLWDCGRKCLDVVDTLRKDCTLAGWRESKSLRSKLHKQYRKTSEIHRKKGKNYQARLKSSTANYLKVSKTLSTKVKYTLDHAPEGMDMKRMTYLLLLKHYSDLLNKHIDLVDRRIIKGETIPHAEKMFSIFEPHTEWINKGKVHKNVELGLNVAISSDQYNFIVDYRVMEKEVDKEVSIAIGNKVVEIYSPQVYIHKSISFDRGFYSKLAEKALDKNYDKVIMPKPGKKSQMEQKKENESEYQDLRKRHSVVEANINALEHHGLNRCPDKGIRGFKKYIALGVISYNLHQLGKLLVQKAKAAQLPTREAA